TYHTWLPCLARVFPPLTYASPSAGRRCPGPRHATPPVPFEPIPRLPSQQALGLLCIELALRQIRGNDERLVRMRHWRRLDRRAKGAPRILPRDKERRRPG